MDETKPDRTTETETQKAEWVAWLQTEIKQVREDIQSSTDSFDTNMLTLSSGALGISLAFIKDIVPLGQAKWLPSLLISWVSFAVCILATVISFRVSKAALKKQEERIRKVFAERTQVVANQKARLLHFCTEVTTYFFLGGLICTMLFVVINVRDFHYEQRQQVRLLLSLPRP